MEKSINLGKSKVLAESLGKVWVKKHPEFFPRLGQDSRPRLWPRLWGTDFFLHQDLTITPSFPGLGQDFENKSYLFSDRKGILATRLGRFLSKVLATRLGRPKSWPIERPKNDLANQETTWLTTRSFFPRFSKIFYWVVPLFWSFLFFVFGGLVGLVLFFGFVLLFDVIGLLVLENRSLLVFCR